MARRNRHNRTRRDEPSGRSERGRPEAVRAQFFALLASGVSVAEASRVVGINGRTGRDWRRGVVKTRGRRFYPGQVIPAGTNVTARQLSHPGRRREAVSSRYLGEAERLVVADLTLRGVGVRAIARELGRSPSTISREVRRNCHQPSGQYRPHAAHRRACARRPRPKQRKLANPALRALVQDLLTKTWSPEQISGWLRQRWPDDPSMNVSPETIYQSLYLQGRGELRRELTQCLRTGRAMRRPHRRPEQRRPRFTDSMVMISERPAEVEDRAVPGHWEGDLILGAGGLSAVGTLVERTTRFVMLVHLPPRDHTAETVRDGLVRVMQTLPDQLRGSLTWDQGSEMARHRSFTIATDMPVYFCDPASPWQRGTNENTNGLLRQFLPKGTDLGQHTPDDLEHIAQLLNTRPRKTLGWETPAQRLASLIN